MTWKCWNVEQKEKAWQQCKAKQDTGHICMHCTVFSLATSNQASENGNNPITSLLWHSVWWSQDTVWSTSIVPPIAKIKYTLPFTITYITPYSLSPYSFFLLSHSLSNLNDFNPYPNHTQHHVLHLHFHVLFVLYHGSLIILCMCRCFFLFWIKDVAELVWCQNFEYMCIRSCLPLDWMIIKN